MSNDFTPRLWPAIVIVGTAAIIAAVTPHLFTRTLVHFVGLIGAPIIAAIAVPVWWLTASRAAGAWRWRPVVAYTIPALLFWLFLYKGDFAVPPGGKYNGNEIPLLLFIVAPIAAVWVAWLTVSKLATGSSHLRGLVALILFIYTGWTAFRIDGTDAAMVPDIRFAWTPSRDELLRQQLERDAAAPKMIINAIEVTPQDWAEFRGPKRDNVVRGVRINDDWTQKPPKELWRRPVGPGWGSFSIAGDLAITMEQRGSNEAVVAYSAATGTPVWTHEYPARFEEFIAKEGPRSTPMIAGGKVYSFGATGILSCVNAATGEPVWSKSIVAEFGAKIPQWGYAASPLVKDGTVYVFTAVPGKAVAAFDATSGALKWAAGNGQHGYSSAHAATIDGVDQVLMVSDFGLEAYSPGDGKTLWSFDWHIKGQNRVAQPTMLPGGDILLGTAVGNEQGAKRLKVTRTGDAWMVDVVWSKRGPRPYFNDGVVHDGHYYGFNDRYFVCIDLKDGKEKWNARDVYDFGQVLLIADQNLLIVQSEKGPVALVDATPEDYTERAKLQLLTGKTWNHPLICRGRLYVRNNAEAACFDISP
jgi:outer membrane protein assembly factor BamB